MSFTKRWPCCRGPNVLTFHRTEDYKQCKCRDTGRYYKITFLIVITHNSTQLVSKHYLAAIYNLMWVGKECMRSYRPCAPMNDDTILKSHSQNIRNPACHLPVCSPALPEVAWTDISGEDNPAAGAWQTSSFIVAAAHWGSLYADYVLTLDDFIIAWRVMVSFHTETHTQMHTLYALYAHSLW